MDYWRREQLGVSAGIATVALFGAGAIVAAMQFPAISASNQEISTFLADHRTRLLTQAFLGGLGLTAGLWFLGSLRSVLRRAEGGTGRVAGIAYGAGITGLVMIGVAELLAASAVYSAGLNDAAITSGMFRLTQVAFAFVGFPMMVVLSATGLLALRTGVLPRAFAALTVIPVAANAVGVWSIFVDGGSFAPGGSVSYLAPLTATLLWVLAASGMLTVKLGQPVETVVARRRISDIVVEPPRAAER